MKQELKDIIRKLHDGATVDDVKAEFQEKFGEVPSSEIAQMEKELMAEGLPFEEVQRLCSVHASVFGGSVADIHQAIDIDKELGHPLYVFRRENDGLERYLSTHVEPAWKAQRESPTEDTKVNLLAELHGLIKLDTHYARKENLFFPYLEREGVTGPPKVMWAVDDEIRAAIKTSIEAVVQDDPSSDEKISHLLEEIRAMITKENQILSPLLIDNLKPADWMTIAGESPQIGFAFNEGIEGASPSDAKTWFEMKLGAADPIVLQSFEEPDQTDDGEFHFPSGHVQVSDFIAMMNTIPCDLTYIDKNDKVRYFTEGPHPVFPRPRTVIDRDVRLCHPQKALPVVEEMLADFKAGRKDSVTRVVARGTKVILIRYLAVRDKEGNYIGTLETTEEMSENLEEIKKGLADAQ